MGSGGSSHSHHSSNDMNENRKRKIIQQAEFIYPKFFIKNAVIETYDRDNVREIWRYVSSNTSPEFAMQRANDPNFSHSTCMIWFFHVFYDRLFDLHPEVKPLFQGNILKQGNHPTLINLNLTEQPKPKPKPNYQNQDINWWK